MIALTIFSITGLVRLFGFLRITVKRLTRSTSDVTLVWPSFCLNSIKSPSQWPNWRRCATSSGRSRMLASRWNLGSLRLRVRRGRQANTVGGQVPPQSVALAFFGIDVTVDRFLADPQRCAFVDHAVAYLFRRSTVSDPLNHMLDQFAFSRTSICLHQVCSCTVITIAARHAFIGEMIALQFSKDGRSAAFQNSGRLIDRDLCMSPAFYDIELIVNGSHNDFSC